MRGYLVLVLYLNYVCDVLVVVFMCVILFFFFFFKQKTAYEMRISDWSSDVCSSDLLAHCRALLRRNGSERSMEISRDFRESAASREHPHNFDLPRGQRDRKSVV